MLEAETGAAVPASEHRLLVALRFGYPAHTQIAALVPASAWTAQAVEEGAVRRVYRWEVAAVQRRAVVVVALAGLFVALAWRACSVIYISMKAKGSRTGDREVRRDTWPTGRGCTPRPCCGPYVWFCWLRGC